MKMRFIVLSLVACSYHSRFTATDAFSTTSFTSPTLSSSKKTKAYATNLKMSDIAIQEKTSFLRMPEQLTNTNNNNIKNDDETEKNEIPSLGTIAKMLPRESFDIDTKTSLFYFGVDFVACVASLGFLDLVVTSDFYHSLPIVAQALTVAPLQILSGFALWCMWCIGHDSGHGTVSRKNWINDVVGEISHSIFCLTPFIPWKKSHLKHHLNHNHLTRDYSHQWFIREEADDLHPIFKFSHKTRNLQLPILYLVYLLFGVPDGGHVFFYGRMWEDEPMKEKIRGALSVAISMTTALSLWMTMGTADFAVVIFAPWLVLSFWLFMVTYLQHHSDDGVLYTDDTWSFTKGAFQTVDRDYGKWINRMSHHMVRSICFY